MMIENPDIGLVIFTVSPKVDFFISKVAMNLGKVLKKYILRSGC